MKTRAISSQAEQECSEGSTTRPYGPDRTMEAHERAAKRIYTPEQKAAKKAYRQANKARRDEYQKRYQKEHRAEFTAYLRGWKRRNADKIKAYAKSYRDRHKEQLIEKSRKEAPGLIKNRLSRRRNNPEYLARHNASRAMQRATLLRATPKWTDVKLMELLYSEAKSLTKATGIQFHVDHEIPLNHPLVCGLHVPENLCVISAKRNMAKQNKFSLDDIV